MLAPFFYGFHQMFGKRLRKRGSRRTDPALYRLWNNLRFYWYSSNQAPWIAGLVLGIGITITGVLTYTMSSSAAEAREINCLALNVYYEARGESVDGMHAVAEVTMNRVASGRYPDTVCEVVHQKRWDTLRKRDVSAFSWTEFDLLPHPAGEPWQKARDAAKAVYHGKKTPVLDGALHYHANYIRPSWSRGKKPVAEIGAHMFYK